MTDKELLELAAKAAGYKMQPNQFIGDYWLKDGMVWNPLTDDGDALRLAVKLRLRVHIRETFISVDMYKEGSWEGEIQIGSIDSAWNDDPFGATREAIVRAAAEIGKTL